ncbi:MAG: Uma2 family endonuclease [Planctomycetia bacterium]|nr:Uma2 family endonuclease [Planctomycetia bacterium]
MSIPPLEPAGIRTLAELLQRLGGVPLERILFRPCPGSAGPPDILDTEQRDGLRCELIAGVLVEKATGPREASLTAQLAQRLRDFVRTHDLGAVSSPEGAFELMADLVRRPNVAFTHWDRLPDRQLPAAAIPRLVPNLAVEVLARANTTAEVAVKRQDYFAAGVEVLWEIDPQHRTVACLDFGTGASAMLRFTDTLTGGTLLPGFALPVAELFAERGR